METVNFLIDSKYHFLEYSETEERLLIVKASICNTSELCINIKSKNRLDHNTIKNIIKYKVASSCINPDFEFILKHDDIYELGISSIGFISAVEESGVTIRLNTGKKYTFNFSDSYTCHQFYQFVQIMDNFISSVEFYKSCEKMASFCKKYSVTPFLVKDNDRMHRIIAKHDSEEIKIDIPNTSVSEEGLELVMSYI